LNKHQIASLIANSKIREELPYVSSVNFTQILSLINKKIKISLFLKTKKVENYINILAKSEHLTIKDYFTTVGVGRNAKTFIDSRVATFLLSELSAEFKYYMINQFVRDGDNLVLDLDRVPINIVK
jgi:hypothetical protein